MIHFVVWSNRVDMYRDGQWIDAMVADDPTAVFSPRDVALAKLILSTWRDA